jgi:hypothetical protein
LKNASGLDRTTGLTATPVWSPLTTTGSLPPGRSFHAATYDTANNRLIVFGGVSSSGPDLNDAWVLTNANGAGAGPSTWSAVSSTGTIPVARTLNHNWNLFDPVSNRMTILWGKDSSNNFLADVWALALPPSLRFPVMQDAGCGKVPCNPSNAPITAVVDHSRKKAYCGPSGYGTVTAFTTESATITDPSQVLGCANTTTPLYGYKNSTINSFLTRYGYNYTGGGKARTLYYDGHPGFDYGFGYGTSLFPSVNGCVTYTKDAEDEPAAKAHVLAIVWQPVPPEGGCQNVIGDPNFSGYQVVYMHLSSYYNNGQVWVHCHSHLPSAFCANAKENADVLCPTCAQEGEWVSTDRVDPIGYSGNFLVTSSNPQGWFGVGPHLHFEVDKVLRDMPFGVDPYGWCGAPGTDPYTTFTVGLGDGGIGLANTNLWQGFQPRCP